MLDTEPRGCSGEAMADRRDSCERVEKELWAGKLCDWRDFELSLDDELTCALAVTPVMIKPKTNNPIRISLISTSSKPGLLGGLPR